MNKKEKTKLLRDILTGEKSAAELLPMTYEVFYLDPSDSDEVKADKLARIELNSLKPNVTNIIVKYVAASDR
jgi:hypothetical protein